MRRIGFAVILLVSLSAPAWADFEEGFAATERGDYATAYREFLPLAEAGIPEAQYSLGLMYHNGYGVPQDYAEAARWYRRAAEQGLAAAQNNLGLMYRNGLGVPQDYAEAVRWYRKAAEQGYAGGQYNLGIMYDRGEGVPQDYTEAARWYRRAAEQGLADAQYNLGVMYDRGYGVPQDFAEAVRWHRRAAEQGLALAQHNLAVAYANGQGVPQDYAEAVRWYRKAAEQGNARAQGNLGVMYASGEGVPRDLVQAHMWFNLAAATLPPGEDRDMAVENRDLAAEQLSPSELARAQEMARNWRPELAESEGAAAATGPSEPPHPSRELVQNVQESLAALGYDPGPADGVLGPKTRAAIRAVEADQGWPVTGEVSETFRTLLLIVRIETEGTAEQRKLEKHSTGSGFVVSHVSWDFLTNRHVVAGCLEVRVRQGQETSTARVVASDAYSDLALLALTGLSLAQFEAGMTGQVEAAVFRAGPGVRPGDGVVLMGFPLQGLLASEAGVTTGTVSVLAGPGDDRRLIQITAPVQPGNSGGPLLDMSGHVVGVVVSKLDAIRVAQATGDIPQNVNFAINALVATAFLDGHGIAYETAPSDQALAPADVAAKAREFTVLVECWK